MCACGCGTARHSPQWRGDIRVVQRPRPPEQRHNGTRAQPRGSHHDAGSEPPTISVRSQGKEIIYYFRICWILYTVRLSKFEYLFCRGHAQVGSRGRRIKHKRTKTRGHTYSDKSVPMSLRSGVPRVMPRSPDVFVVSLGTHSQSLKRSVLLDLYCDSNSWWWSWAMCRGHGPVSQLGLRALLPRTTSTHAGT